MNMKDPNKCINRQFPLYIKIRSKLITMINNIVPIDIKKIYEWYVKPIKLTS